MALPDMVSEVRYVTNESGEKTDVLLSLEVWSQLLQLLQVLMEQLDKQENAETVRSWLPADTGNPYVRSAGIFKDDPMFDEFVEAMAQHRQQEDAAIAAQDESEERRPA